MGYNYVSRKNAIENYNTETLIIHIYQCGVRIFENDLHKIVCEGGLHPNYEATIKNIQSYGRGTGVEQEMKARFELYRGTK